MTEQNKKPIIFLAFANEQGHGSKYLRNLPSEVQHLQRALDQAETQKICQLKVRTNATLSGIRDVFRTYDSHIAVFHFGGHANSDQLLFESEGGKTVAVDATGFAGFLAQQAGLQLVFLNACSTAGQVSALQAAGVPMVIATDKDILDEVATDFADEFYKSLATGTNGVRKAFAEAAALVKAGRGGNLRNMLPVTPEQPQSDQPPWQLFPPQGAAENDDWSLQIAAGDPLFGLPPLPKLDLPETPYRHLEWFRREDAELFFGRGREIADLYQKVMALDGAPIILFYGQSGVGKSSVLAAGLLPRLDQKHSVRYQRREQAKGLVGTLAVALSGTDYTNLWCEAEARAQKPLTVILDQVEELFTRPNVDLPNEMEDFLAVLKDIFTDREQRPQGRLILSFRKEWLAEIETALKGQALPSPAKSFLERLGKQGIIETIDRPARVPRLTAQYGLSVAKELPDLIADRLLDDLGSPVAPMLQILLTRLWNEVKDNPRPYFDKPLYDRLRAEGLGLDDFLKRQIDCLQAKQAQAVESGLVLDLLACHTTPLGTAEQHTQNEVDEMYEREGTILRPLMQECRELYLLVDQSANQPDQPHASRLAHDTLAPHVRKRFDESIAPGQLARRILQSRVGKWDGIDETSRPAPLDSHDLKVVEDGQAGMRVWTNPEKKLIKASREERQRRQRRERTIIKTGVIALLVIIAAVGTVGVLWRQQLNRQAGIALLQEARDLRAKGNVTDAIVAFTNASAYPELKINLSVEISDTRRVGATIKVQEGEALLRTNPVGQQAYISATNLFSAALAFTPPPDTPVYVKVAKGPISIGLEDSERDILIKYCIKLRGSAEFCPPSDFASAQPTSTVDLDDFWIMRTEVTNAQYMRCVEAKRTGDSKGCEPPNSSRWDKPEYVRQPVVGVTWVAATQYATWVGGRLPTEAEWEKACRGPDPHHHIYPWGNTEPKPDLLNYSDSGLGIPRGVGSYPQGESPYHVLDMAGNVSEWTNTLWGEKSDSPTYRYPYRSNDGRENLNAPATVNRVVRGGQLGSRGDRVYCAYRVPFSSNESLETNGFRVMIAPR